MRWHQVREALRLAMMASVLASSLAVATPASAQTNVFGGVTAVDVIVESPDALDPRCGVTKGGLDAAVRLPLDGSRIAFDKKATDFIYARATFDIAQGMCFGFVELEFHRGLYTPDGKTVSGGVWGRDSLIRSPDEEFGLTAYSVIEQYTKQLIAEWIKGNPR